MGAPCRVGELLFSVALLTEQRRADYRFVIWHGRAGRLGPGRTWVGQAQSFDTSAW